jgi:hypothetical protein
MLKDTEEIVFGSYLSTLLEAQVICIKLTKSK